MMSKQKDWIIPDAIRIGDRQFEKRGIEREGVVYDCETDDGFLFEITLTVAELKAGSAKIENL